MPPQVQKYIIKHSFFRISYTLAFNDFTYKDRKYFIRELNNYTIKPLDFKEH